MMDEKLKILLDRMNQDNGITIIHDGNIARIFSQQPHIRKMRKNGHIYIAKDRRKNVTLIYRK